METEKTAKAKEGQDDGLASPSATSQFIREQHKQDPTKTIIGGGVFLNRVLTGEQEFHFFQCGRCCSEGT